MSHAVLALTGAGGFIGRHLRAAASTAGHEVRVLSHKVPDATQLAHSLHGVATLVHLAARLPGRGRRRDAEPLFTADNVRLTAQFADAAVRAGVGRFVFVSSAGVLGRQSPLQGLDDATTPAPYDAYTRSKLAAEMLLEDYAQRLEVVIVRPPMVYGPDAGGLLGTLLRLARAGWPMPVPALDAPRSLVSVRNLCDLLLRACTADGVRGARMLVADTELIGLRALARSIAAAAAPVRGHSTRTVEVPAWLVRGGLDLLSAHGSRRKLDRPFVLRCTQAWERLGWRAPLRQADELAWSVQTFVPAPPKPA